MRVFPHDRQLAGVQDMATVQEAEEEIVSEVPLSPAKTGGNQEFFLVVVIQSEKHQTGASTFVEMQYCFLHYIRHHMMFEGVLKVL